jgi:pyruvate/2-oxoglutarate dehydrogenase complex dihydrolipoamide acyltransferase (E2) component
MPIVDVLVPQMGEGLQEVLIVEFQKKPGDRIRRDETFYNMETDKATMEVESPHDGILVEWLAREGDTVPIGAPIARMELVAEAAVAAPSAPRNVPTIAGSPMATLSTESVGADLRERNIPPRTRAYAREKGIADEILATIAAAGSKLMPADIDAFLDSGSTASPVVSAPTIAAPIMEAQDGEYQERPLSVQDKTFIYRLKRSASMVVQATAKRQMDWGAIRAFADKKKAEQPELSPSAFQCVAWCIGQAVREHPKFRSSLVREDTVREFRHLNMGIAVAVQTGELTIAVVREADSLPFEAFVREAKERINEAREGNDQADESTHMMLTYMGPYEVTDAVPVLVAPAASVLFIGSAFEQGGKQVVNLALAFDHRLIHGVEAAEFLRTIVHNATHIEELVR